MHIKKTFAMGLPWIVAGVFAIGISVSFANLTFTGTAINGDSSSTIDVGSGNTLQFQTANNGPIITGSGLFTLGGGLKLSLATSTQCLHEASGTVSGTGSDCAAPGGSTNDFQINSSGTFATPVVNGTHNVTWNLVGSPTDYGYMKLVMPTDHNGIGQFQSILTLANAAASTSPTNFTLDTDGEFHIDQYHIGTSVAHFRLDPQSDLALWSGAATSTTGAAFSTNSDGHTCLAGICIGVNGVFTTPSTLMSLNNLGTVDYYRGVALANCVACNGITGILYHNDSLGLAADISNFTIYTTTASGYGGAGLYQLSGYIVSSSTQANTVMTVTVSYTDDTGANSQAVASSSFAVRGAKVPFSFTLFSASSSAIQISYTHASGSQPTYNSHLTLTEL